MESIGIAALIVSIISAIFSIYFAFKSKSYSAKSLEYSDKTFALLKEQHEMTQGENLNRFINEACESFKHGGTPINYIRTIPGISNEEKETIWQETFRRHKGRPPKMSFLETISSEIEPKADYVATDGAEFECIRVCQWNGKLWGIGDRFKAPAGQEIPHHFKLISGEAEKKL